MTLKDLNALTEGRAREEFLRCCGSSRWAAAMAAERPFPDRESLHEAAERHWLACAREDRLEAFSHHPRIGDVGALRAKFAATADWAGQEQGKVAGASEAVIDALAQGNKDYEARFGFIFLVCATGKTADEMLALLKARLGNAPGPEFEIAAGEQAKITRLRLEKLLA